MFCEFCSPLPDSYCPVCASHDDNGPGKGVGTLAPRREIGGRIRFRLFNIHNDKRHHAKSHGIPFSITPADLEMAYATHCPYLGVELIYFGHGHDDRKATVDRIIPELGYVPGNVQFISRLANSMKSKATAEQMVTFAKAVLSLHDCAEAT